MRFCGLFRSAIIAAKRSRSAAPTNSPRFPRIQPRYIEHRPKGIFCYRQSTSARWSSRRSRRR
jgi:hypothetical protein